jgi:putative transposase
MAGTFSQLYIQIVFSVKGRQNLIKKEWSEELYKYIAGIIKGKNQKPIIVNGMPDHINIFVGLRPAMSIADLVRDIKSNSSNFINEKKWIKGKFAWQEGYGAFSYAQSQVNDVYNYILRQEKIRNLYFLQQESTHGCNQNNDKHFLWPGHNWWQTGQ